MLACREEKKQEKKEEKKDSFIFASIISDLINQQQLRNHFFSPLSRLKKLINASIGRFPESVKRASQTVKVAECSEFAPANLNQCFRGWRV